MSPTTDAETEIRAQLASIYTNLVRESRKDLGQELRTSLGADLKRILADQRSTFDEFCDRYSRDHQGLSHTLTDGLAALSEAIHDVKSASSEQYETTAQALTALESKVDVLARRVATTRRILILVFMAVGGILASKIYEYRHLILQ